MLWRSRAKPRGYGPCDVRRHMSLASDDEGSLEPLTVASLSTRRVPDAYANQGIGIRSDNASIHRSKHVARLLI